MNCHVRNGNRLGIEINRNRSSKCSYRKARKECLEEYGIRFET